ncbi:MAG: MFS transporter [Candidatus Levyibacteriota bacterium]
MKKLLKQYFPAFKSRNYRLYFIGQFISLIGTWLQVVAESWLVLTLTNSAFLIGLVAACATLPTLFLSLFGGVIVDRYNKKKIIYVTQFASLILAFIYGLLTVLHLITIWEIMVLAFLLGIVNSLDIPARQAFTVEMVGKEDLGSAITINSATFNGARIVGPSIAGILIALVGSGGAFLINSASYLAAIAALYFMHIAVKPHAGEHPHPIQAIKEGVSYSFSHPHIRSLILLTGIVSIFGWSYATVMPLIAKNSFHVGAGGLGYLYSVVGLGALASVFMVQLMQNKIGHLGLIVGGVAVFALSLIGFTFANSFVTATPFLFTAGIGLLTSFSTINTQIQHSVEDKFRGRVLSIYVLAFSGLFPIGNFEIGWVSEHIGPLNAIRVGSVIVLLSVIIYYLSRNKRRERLEEYHVQREEQIPQPILEQAEG